MRKLSFNTEKTKALLIGVSEYDYLPQIGPVKNNLVDFANILADSEIIGLPVSNIISLIDFRHDEIINAIDDFLYDENNVDIETLILYYAGHGYRDPKDKMFYLTGTNSKKESIRVSAFLYKEIKDRIESSQIQNRIIFLDACYSGLATMSEEIGILQKEELDIKGTYTIASSSGDEKSYFNPVEKHTFFTSTLINTLNEGFVLSQQNFVTLDELYGELKKKLYNLSMPEPKRMSNLNITNYYFFKNKKNFNLIQNSGVKINSTFSDVQEFNLEAKQKFLTSDEWFSEVIKKLERATNAHIYLRAFQHPNEAKKERQEEIVNMMKSFARIIYEHPAQIKIVAYSTKSVQRESAKSWLFKEISNKYGIKITQAKNQVNSAVTLINQPCFDDMFSIYIINERYIYYAQKAVEKYVFAYYEFDNRTIPNLIKKGFDLTILN
ncbi:caspase family protein [Spirosoma sp. BT702]|uniref:Caspase family protein n=1 Tax=Spirosoma profusum TaxID=2771354 RepID=A0A926Y4M7_9BACT|nr:caspase family protein [Spirosoma profusum]MBD2703415.1 caspase family protein [Spirosoma profusum]